MQCANCGHDNPGKNKFCGECGQLLNDPHEVGRFSVMQAHAKDAEALSASVDGIVDPDRAPFPNPEQIPGEFLDQWRPIDADLPGVQPVYRTPERRPEALHVAPEMPHVEEPRSNSSVLGLSTPEIRQTPSRNSFLALESDEDPVTEHNPLHGPSFLGLGDAQPEYIYEDAKPPRTRMWLALIVAVFLVVLGALQWRSISEGLRYSKEGILRISLPGRGKAAQTAPPAASEGSTDAAQNPTQNSGSDAAQSGTPQIVVEPPKSSASDTSKTTADASSSTATPDAPASAVKDSSSASEKDSSHTAKEEPPAGGAAASTADESPAAASSDRPAAAARSAEAVPDTPPSKAVETATAKPPKPAETRRAPEPLREEPPRSTAGEAEFRSALAANDPALQTALLWKAVAKGNVDAQVRLSDMYANGIGVPQNCDQALVLMRAASAKPNARARVKMGSMYANGKCVGQDRVAAYRWMSRALELDPGSDWVRSNRQSLWAQMSPDERIRAGGR